MMIIIIIQCKDNHDDDGTNTSHLSIDNLTPVFIVLFSHTNFTMFPTRHWLTPALISTRQVVHTRPIVLTRHRHTRPDIYNRTAMGISPGGNFWW